MAFTLEDGTGVAGANTYMTDVELKAYHADRGNNITAGSGALQQALVRATDYIETRFAHRLKGAREFEAQPLSFPRSGLYNWRGDLVTGIPDKLKNALAEYAIRALAGELYVEPTVDATGNRVVLEREKIGPIETEKRFSKSHAVQTAPVYPEADYILREYLKASGEVVRA